MGTDLQHFKQNLRRVVQDEEFALPSNVSKTAFQDAVVVAFQTNPQIARCDEQSLFASIRSLAASGLVPDGREAALVPFNTKVVETDHSTGKKSERFITKCQAMPMVAGLMKMVRRSGTVSDINAHVVYQNEVDQGRFTYVLGDKERLVHDPILFGPKGDPIGCYAIATLTSGQLVREWMDFEQIETVRKSAASQRVGKGQNRKPSETPIGIWKTWQSEMWRKTVIRRVTKRLDMSAEDQRMVMNEHDFEHMRDVTPADAPEVKSSSKPSLRDQIGILPDTDKDTVIIDSSASDHWTESVDTSNAAPMDHGWDDGIAAFNAGTPRSECPFTDHREAGPWLAGWDQAKSFADDQKDADQ